MKRIAWTVLAALMLYVLSIGPAWRSQLGIVHRLFDPVGRYRLPGTLLANYINLWLPRNDSAAWDPRLGVVVIEGNPLDSQ
jgi:hypothetical protein